MKNAIGRWLRHMASVLDPDPKEPPHDCQTNVEPNAVICKNGVTAILWKCDDCPGVWSELIHGEFTLADVMRKKIND